MIDDLDLDTFTPCPSCAKLMVKIHTSNVTTEETRTTPILREWRWFCGCGYSEAGGWDVAGKVSAKAGVLYRYWTLVNLLSAVPEATKEPIKPV